jgi:hypothetical protein
VSRSIVPALVAWTQIVSNVAVVVGVAIVLPMYLLQREDADSLQRRELAVQMYLHKYSETVSPAYRQVGNAFDRGNQLFQIVQGSGDPDARKAAAAQIVEQAGQENIGIMVSYFEDVINCAERGQCDRKLALELLQPDLTPFYCKVRLAGLPELREAFHYPDYGAALARHAGNCRAAPVAPATR